MTSKIHCDWCGNDFEQYIGVTQEGERDQVRCTKCFRTLPSSIKVMTGEKVGSNHYHKEYPGTDAVKK